MLINKKSNQFCDFTLDIHLSYLELKIREIEGQLEELREERNKLSDEFTKLLESKQYE